MLIGVITLLALTHSVQYCLAESVKAVDVAVSLKASWSVSSPLIESIQFYSNIYNNDNGLVWQYIDHIIDNTNELHTLTYEQQYNIAVDSDKHVHNDGVLIQQLYNQSLVSHIYAPKVQVYNNLITDLIHTNDAINGQCTQILSLGNQISCVQSDSDVKATIKKLASTYNIDADTVKLGYDVTYGTGTAELVLYSDITHNKQFKSINQALKQYVDSDNQFKYVLRAVDSNVIYSTQTKQHPLYLTGYGVELQLKNVEYKVLDDKHVELSSDALGSDEFDDTDVDDMNDIQGIVFGTLKQRYSDIAQELNEVKHKLLESQTQSSDVKLKGWDIQSLGIQSLQRILHHKDQLIEWQHITQNFPAYVTSLSKVAVNSTIKQSLLQLNRIVHSQFLNVNYMSINGISVDIATLDVYELYHVFARDTLIVNQLQQYKLPATAILQLLQLSPSISNDAIKPTSLQSMDRSPASLQSQAKTNLQISANRVDMQLSSNIATKSIVWLNDIESDFMYSSWSSSINEFRVPRWPNQLVYTRHNLYNGVLFIDLSTIQGITTLITARFFIEGYAPLHAGVVFVTHNTNQQQRIDTSALPASVRDILTIDNADSTAQHVSTQSALLYLYLRTAADSTAASRYVTELSNIVSTTVTDDNMKTAFKAAVKSSNKLLKLKWKMSEYYYSALNNTENIQKLNTAQTYIQTLGINNNAEEQQLLCNGYLYSIYVQTQVDYRDLIMSCIQYEQAQFSRLAYAGLINDSVKPYEYIMKQPNVVPRLAPHITDTTEYGIIPTDVQYLQHEDNQYSIAALSYVVYTDVTTVSGLNALYAAMQHIKHKSLQSDNSLIVTRLAVVLNTNNNAHITVKLVHTIQNNLKASKQASVLLDITTIALSISNDTTHLEQAYDAYIATDDVLKSKLSGYKQTDTSKITQQYLSNTIVVNGRVIQLPQHSTYHELIAEFKLLDTHEYKYHHAAAIVDIVSHTELSTDIDSVNQVVSQVALRINQRLSHKSDDSDTPVKRVANANDGIWNAISNNQFSKHVSIHHTSADAVHTVNVIIDSLSVYAQRVSAILNALRHMYNVNIHIILVPSTTYSEIPLKRYYRYCIDHQLSFYHTNTSTHSIGALKPSASTTFSRLHTTALLSMNIVDTPESWLVSLSQSDYDIDNLQLSTLNTRKINVQYLLDYLLINGMCSDSATLEQPAGLQLQLLSSSDQFLTDTVVMQNLGYFQLHTQPGVQHVVFSEQHNTVYTFDNNSNAYNVIVDTFDAPYIKLKVLKRAEKRNVDLLASTTENQGWFNSAKSLISGKTDAQHQLDQSQYVYNADDIHVFSLASGHLYERFLKIMMLSVIEHTDKHVHFWFLSNFLSPQFKQSVQYMQTEYNNRFTTHFITYRWPQWLRQQTEKQRIIWGYKILFLDVLFPLSVKRIVYIDSDQIVRSDINELMTMNLHNAPYAYTPFCSDNHDVDGYRFWRSGFWAEHLRGKPYHISALYVVDLDRFRRTRAGDTLRITYDNLSSDPNSLANLDQDLPNYTQHQVPIYSLPQQWLWCQTWCSMDTLAQAKTIDLCNNPLTKKPKLDVARELIPEWTVYDNRASDIDQQRIERSKRNNAAATSNSIDGTSRHDEL